MKMTLTHYDELKKLCISVKEKYPNITPESYRLNKIGKDTDERFRWDLFHTANKRARADFLHDLYKYLHDDQVRTALKRIVKEIYLQ